MFRDCDECAVCCKGFLIGTIYGRTMNKNTPCHFLLYGDCCIYDQRPKVCRNYQCAWTQKLFPEWMRPDKCGTLISVERDNGRQYLKAISINITEDVKAELNKFARENLCEVIYVRL